MASSSDVGAFARLRATLAARFRLYADWRRILRHSWSIRFALLAALFSGLEVVLAVFTNDPPIERGTFAALSGAVTVMAAVARLFAQTKLGDAE
ncbi:hypothetical protein FHR71_001141 [Methylobacterium sp. RAS18]|nr:hypothetical protein [Methylobacterium sp. RAS18]